MALQKLLDEAANRLEEASFRIDEVRAKPFSQERACDWLAAPTEYCAALNDIQRLNNESFEEKLQAIARHLKLEQVL